MGKKCNKNIKKIKKNRKFRHFTDTQFLKIVYISVFWEHEKLFVLFSLIAYIGYYKSIKLHI